MVCKSAFASGVAAALATTASTSTAPRYAVYFDQYHTAVLPNKTLTAGVTHVITAFANSSLFAAEPAGTYTPFMAVPDVRAMFDNGTKVCMAIGGWGDTVGFRAGAKDAESRARYAKNIAATVDALGYDCVDVDWEYPGGNGADWKQVPNADITSEIDTFPLLLAAIKAAIGADRELSIAVPGLKRDMIAYTAQQVPLIDRAVDFVNVMSYDLINRRDHATRHHTDVAGSLAAVDAYIARGIAPAKLNLGIAFYAKYFTLAANTTCAQPTGCPIALAEAADGSDTGVSGAVTFEKSSFPAVVDTGALVPSPAGTCGAGTTFKCTGDATQGACCSQYGFCGATSAHCGQGCQADFGTCADSAKKTTAQSFADALANGRTDAARGGQWWVDAEAGLFWTWETPELIARKFTDIVAARGLGGVMAWSLAEDSNDWALLKALQDGVGAWRGNVTGGAPARRVRRTRY